MLAASPHRGGTPRVLRAGDWLLGATADLLEVDGLAVAFAGVIDNRDGLSADLLPPPDAALSQGPAGLVLRAFRTYREATPARLRGPFAVLITDGRQLWAFRDHAGLRPLFYRVDGDRVFVASELKQVLAGAALRREADLDGLARLFFGGYASDIPTAVRGVRRLPAASLLIAGPSGHRVTRYWNPERLLESARLSDQEIHDRFASELTRASGRVLTGNDVVSLSGGVDSPAVAAYAAGEHRRLFGRPIAALTATYPEYPAVDERAYAEQVARYLEIPLETYQQQQISPLADLERWVDLLDGPAPMAAIQDAAEHYRKAQQLGFTTMLTGDLAESVTETRLYLLAHLLLHGRWSALWRQVRAQRAQSVRWRRIGRQLAGGMMPRSLAAAFETMRPSYRGSPIPDWLEPAAVKAAAGDIVAPLRRRWADHQLEPLTQPDLLLEADEVCQAVCGVQVRRPWIDVDLWEFFLSLPAEVKFPDGRRKSLLRRLLRGRVPDIILDRTEKTLFDSVTVARIDYAGLGRWLSTGTPRIRGVKYDVLMEHLRRRDLDLVGYRWAKDLAQVHAFLSLS
jgi:asparagine synthase (glutamine-hydrolysing)